MRFFAHDGQTLHGPSRVDELTKLPNFDGDTLVCPVGSENSTDWKPALAYPPFRAVLLAPAPKPAAAPAPRPMAPPPAQATVPCPRCSFRNAARARFCNDCGARMDGSDAPPPPADAPAAAAPIPVPAVPMPEPTPPPAFAPEPAAFDYSPAVITEVPDVAPAPVPAAPAWRKPALAVFVGASVASAAVAWYLLRPAKRAAPSPEPELNLSAPAPSRPIAPAETMIPVPAPAAPVAAAPAPAAVAPVPAAPAPVAPAPVAPKPAPPKAAKPKRIKSVRAPRAKKAAVIPADKPVEKPAEPEAAKTPPPSPSAPADDGFLLPGVPRRLPPAKKAAPGAKAAAAKADAPAPAAPADPAEDSSTSQVREQFEFCAQLLNQGAYADHFDTCLCASARQASPYRGDRKIYAADMKKLADAFALETTVKPGGIVLEDSSAKVTAGKEVQRWSLEDGLWCRAQ